MTTAKKKKKRKAKAMEQTVEIIYSYSYKASYFCLPATQKASEAKDFS